VETDARTPRPFRLLAWPLLVLSLGFFGYSWAASPPTMSLQLLFVVLAAALSEFFALQLPQFTFSLAYPFAMSAILLAGPAGAGLVAAFSAISFSDLRRQRPASVLAFNFGQLMLEVCLAGWTYLLLGGRVMAISPSVFRPLAGPDFPSALYGMLACAVVFSITNLLLISLGVSLLGGARTRDVFLSSSGLVPTQVALAFVGFLMAQVLTISVIALPLFVFPLAVARQLHERYTGLREAYVGTVRSLVGALEAKDPYTRGHSERVAEYAVALGQAMNLEASELERLEYAALLHDLGKLAVPGAVLAKPGRLEPVEMDRIREHPARGADMIARIPPLRDLAETIGQHHERIDGGGYPGGIAGDRISMPARILAVADSYDAMTTTRAYRPALDREGAIAELLGGAGSQFDAQVVRTFIESRVGRVVVPASDDEVASAAVVSVQED